MFGVCRYCWFALQTLRCYTPNIPNTEVDKLRRQFSRPEVVDQNLGTNTETKEDEGRDEVDDFDISTSVDTGEVDNEPDNPEGHAKLHKRSPHKQNTVN